MVVSGVLMMRDPSTFTKVNIKFILWIISGFILIFILFIKISTIIKIYKRSKDPECYVINFFGKKVYKNGLVNKQEFLTLFLTIPFFLLVGSYFVARLINILLYGSF